MKKESLKVGDIVQSHYWHYYGTAVDFYKVSKICAKTVNLIPLENRYTFHSVGGDESSSVPGGECKEARGRHFIRFVDGVAKIGRHEAEIWDGRPVTTYSYS